jgi:hypothetical protein
VNAGASSRLTVNGGTAAWHLHIDRKGYRGVDDSLDHGHVHRESVAHDYSLLSG